MDVYTITVLSNIALFSFLAISAWLLLLVGEISFGQQAYFAIGAYIGEYRPLCFNYRLALLF